MAEFLQGSEKTEGMKVGIVVSRFNSDVTQKLERGALEFLKSKGVSREDCTLVRVPGAFEIPLAVKFLLETKCEGVVALGAVIRGETSHYDYVCSAVERGCSELQLQYDKPVAFGVLTTDTDQQALARAGGSAGNKGAEAAQVLVEMVNLKRLIKSELF